MSDEVVARVCEDPETPVRHFMCVRVVQWDGDLVLSAFVRFTRVARTLYAEVTYTLLYRSTDSRWVQLGQQALSLPGTVAVTRLLDPYPNPFNPRVTIPFTLDASRSESGSRSSPA